MREPDSKHFAGSYHWRVEYNRTDPQYQGRRTNHHCSAVAPTLEVAARVVLDKFPDAVLIKVFRGDQWGYDGLLISPESEATEQGRVTDASD